jgi:hypothetical protein
VRKRTYIGFRRWNGKTRWYYFVQLTDPDRLYSQNSMAIFHANSACITSPVLTRQKDSPYCSGVTQTFLGLSMKY